MSVIRGFRLPVVGIAFSMLLGSGLVATVSDSVLSRRNDVSSGAVAFDLRVANPGGPAITCPSDGAYSGGPVPAIFETEGMNDATPPVVRCLKNFSVWSGRLALGFLNVVDSEAGCSPGEAAAGDATCRPGDRGELSEVLEVLFTKPDSRCGSTETMVVPFRDLMAGLIDLRMMLEPGVACRLGMQVRFARDLPSAAAERAQTDRIQWDISFVLQEGQPTSGKAS